MGILKHKEDKSKLTLLGHGRESFDRSLVTVRYKVQDSEGENPEFVELARPFKTATNVVKGNRYPAMDGYDKNTGILSFTFEVVDSGEYGKETTHTFISNVTLPDGTILPINLDVVLKGYESAPTLIVTSSTVIGKELHINAEIRRANGKIPKSIKTVSLTKSDGIRSSKPASVKYNAGMSGSLTMVFEVQEESQTKSAFDIAADVYITESELPGKLAVSVAREIEKGYNFNVRECFLFGDTLDVQVNVRSLKETALPHCVELPRAFSTAIGVPSGSATILSQSYDKETGILRFKIKVRPVRGHDVHYSFICMATVNSEETPFDIQCLVAGTNNVSLEYLSCDKTPAGYLSVKYKVIGVEGKVFAYLGTASEVENLINVKAKGVNVSEDNSEIEVILTPMDLNEIAGSYYARGYISINNAPVEFEVSKTFKSVSEIVNHKVEKRGNKVIFTFPTPLLKSRKVVDIVEPRLYENGVLTEKKPTLVDISSNGTITLHYDATERTDSSILYRATGKAKIQNGETVYSPYYGLFGDYFTLPAPVKINVVSHDLLKLSESMVLNIMFDDGTYPINVGRLYPQDFYIEDRGQPTKFEYDKTTGNLTIGFMHDMLPDVKNVSTLTGGIKLPDYNMNDPLYFTSTAMEGSDYYPAKTKHGKLENGKLTGKVVNKDGSFPTTLDFHPLVIDNVSKHHFTYDNTTGEYVLTAEYPERTSYDLVHKLVGELIPTKMGEKSVLALTGTEITPRIPSFSAKLISTEFNDNAHTGKFSYQCEWDNGEIPGIVMLGAPYCIGTSLPRDFEYNQKTGIASYSFDLNYTEGELPIRHNVALVDGHLQGSHVDTNMKYAPRASATLVSAQLNVSEEKLLVRWALRDCNGLVPKDYRYKEKEWINDEGIAPGKVVMEYNKDSGILLAIFPAKINFEGPQRYTAWSKFKFPSPDVNEYPLTFDVER